MSGHDFDRLTQSLAARASRRSVLKGLLGAAAGAVAGMVGRGSAQAAVSCGGYGGPCAADDRCCQTEASTCHQGRHLL